MLTKGVKKYFTNPVLGLLSGVVCILLYLFTNDIALSLVISIVFAALSDVFVRNFTGTKISGIIFRLSLISFVISLIIWFVLKDTYIPDIFYLLFSEVLIVCALIFSRLSRIYIRLYLGPKPSAIQKAFFDEFFEIAKLTEYALTFHLFIVLLYRLIRINYKLSVLLDVFIYFLIPVILLVVIIVYQELKIKKIVNQLRKEEWLPIVTESGEVTGRIAKSLSLSMKNKFLHPVVRVALIYEGQVFLQKRPLDDVLAPETYDYPFEKYMLYNNEINVAARNSITQAIGEQDFNINYLLKYVYENENTKRLIFLFFTRVQTDDQLQSLNKLSGKFWTTKQIEDNFVDEGFFSECFELEYEYLKNTVLQSDELMKSAIS